MGRARVLFLVWHTGNRLLEAVRNDSRTGTASARETRTYTATGSPENKDAHTYIYNGEQRPTRVSKNGQTLADYLYNSFGERIQKVTYTQTKGQRSKVTYFLYDGHTLTAEAAPGGKVLAQYLYFNNQPIAKLDGKQIYAIHTDHLGTPRAASDAHGTNVWRADYSPFGEATVSRESITLNLRFPGQYYDAETGTHYNYLRDYDPKTGRYLTSDPIGLKGGLNTYGYVGGDPISFADPSGLVLKIRICKPGPCPIEDLAESKAELYGLDTTEVLEGLETVPKPAADSTFMRKLAAVFSEVVFQFQNNPKYNGNQAFIDFSQRLWNDLPKIAGAILLFTGMQAMIPPPINLYLDVALITIAAAMLGGEALVFLGKLAMLAVQVSSIDANDGIKLQCLGENFAESLWDTGLGAAEAGLLGMFGAVGRLGKLFPTDALKDSLSKVKGDSYADLKESITKNAPKTTARKITLKDGYYQVEGGMKISKQYYERLWREGRPAPFVQAEEILKSNPNIIPDPQGRPGFFRYEADGLELIYNPKTKEIWHIMPIYKKK